MRVDVAKYLGREFSWRNYNCWDLTRDVWLDLTGVDLGKRTPAKLDKDGIREAFEHEQDILRECPVNRVPGPVDPCIVFMLRPKVMSHVGVFTQQRVLHLIPRQGVFLQDFRMATSGFEEVRFYK